MSNNSAVPLTKYNPLKVTIQGEWLPWQNKVPQIEVETHKVASPDVVVPTLDTVRHESLLYTWLAEHKPLVLCGPPGSGKTMTLFSALRALPDMEVGYVFVYQWLLESLKHYLDIIILELQRKAESYFQHTKSTFSSDTHQSMKRRIKPNI